MQAGLMVWSIPLYTVIRTDLVRIKCSGLVNRFKIGTKRTGPWWTGSAQFVALIWMYSTDSRELVAHTLQRRHCGATFICAELRRTASYVKRWWRNEKKWNESGFRPPLCTYRLNWARRTSWGWWDDWDDTVLQTQDSKFEPWRSEAEHATSRSRRLPTILTFTRGWGRNIFCFFQTAETGNRTPDSGVKGSGANHYPRAPAHKALMA